MSSFCFMPKICHFERPKGVEKSTFDIDFSITLRSSEANDSAFSKAEIRANIIKKYPPSFFDRYFLILTIAT